MCQLEQSARYLWLPCGDVESSLVEVDEPRQRQGFGHLLDAALDDLRQGGTRRVMVGTSSSSIGPLNFDQPAGFRVPKVERDYVSTARGHPNELEEHGIPVRDMLSMDRDLSVPTRGSDGGRENY